MLNFWKNVMSNYKFIFNYSITHNLSILIIYIFSLTLVFLWFIFQLNMTRECEPV